MKKFLLILAIAAMYPRLARVQSVVPTMITMSIATKTVSPPPAESIAWSVRELVATAGHRGAITVNTACGAVSASGVQESAARHLLCSLHLSRRIKRALGMKGNWSRMVVRLFGRCLATPFPRTSPSCALAWVLRSSLSMLCVAGCLFCKTLCACLLWVEGETVRLFILTLRCKCREDFFISHLLCTHHPIET